ncbi:MAG: MBL fold metallo-hydrolase [Bacteriovoracaceae bacterium]
MNKKKQHRFSNRIPHLVSEMNKEAMTFSTFKAWFTDTEKRTPKKPLPEVKPDLKEFLKPSPDLKVIWFGHSTFLLNLLGKIILVDPVFSNNAAPVTFFAKRFQPPVLKLEELPPIDFIIISHDHYDHLDKETMQFFAKKMGKTKILTALGVGKHLTSWGIKKETIREFNWWQGTKIDEIEFIATPAQHFSGRSLTDRNKTLWSSWVIITENQRLYFSGDSGYDIHFKEIGHKYGPFDIAFMENGQYNERWRAVHSMPHESVQAYFDLKAKRFFPVHWGMFVLSLHSWREPADELLRLSQERGVNIVTPILGEIVTVNDNYKNKLWWLTYE